MAGIRPKSSSERLNVALSSAITTSLAATRPTPPAFALPRTCATERKSP